MAIQFEIGLRLSDAQLKSQLSSINKDLTRAFTVKNADGSFSKEIAAAATQAKALEKALAAATTNKGISYSQLNMELAKAGTTAGKLTSTLAQGGTYFRQSLDSANNALALSNRHVISLNRTLQEAARVFKQSFKFTVAQTAIRAISTEIRESVQWVANLSDAVNNIAVVTGKTAGQITNVTNQAVQGSKELRIAAEDYAKGALVFYQQGLNDDEVIRRNETTIKAAKAANQSIDEMSQQLTAIWNTYGMVGDEQMRAASVGAKMAASNAVNFADIAQAMQSAAAPAAQMGVEYNQLAAIIATVGDVTQQSASIIGNAYKTIFSRFQQLVSDGTDGEVTLGSVSQKLQDLGVQLLNSDGTLRNLGETINMVGNNWSNWSEEQQLAIAQLVGGTRQYGQFLALMQNFDKYQSNLSLAATETGSTLEQQYNQVLDSIESRAENAGEAWHRAFSNLITTDEIKGAYKALEDFGNVADNVIKGLGGLPGIFTMVAVLLSSKVIPALQVAAHTAVSFGASLVGKQSTMIDKDFNKNAAAIEKSDLSQSEKEAALAKNEFSRQTAIINEQINSQLSTATGLRRTELEMQRQQLAETQKTFTATISETQALERAVEARLQGYQKEQAEVDGLIQKLEEEKSEELEKINHLQEELAVRKEIAAVTAEEGKKEIRRIAEEKLGADSNNPDRYSTGNFARAKEKNEKRMDSVNDEISNRQGTVSGIDSKLTEANKKKEEQAIQRLATAYSNLQLALSKYQKQLQAGKTDEAAKTIKDAKVAASELGLGLGELGSRFSMTEGQVEEFQNVLANIDEGADLIIVSDQVHNVGTELEKMTVQAEGAEKAVSAFTAEQRTMISDATKLGEQTGIAAQKQQEQYQALLAATRYQEASLSSTLSLTTQFISSLGMGINSVKNLYTVLNNPDLSGPEKLLQVFTSLSSMMMFIVPSMSGIIKKIDEFGRATIKAAEAEALAATMADKEAIAHMAAAKAKDASGAAALRAGLMTQIGFMPVWAIIIGITAAVVALTAAFIYLSSEAKNKSLEEQLSRAQEAAAKLAEAEDQARDAADKLRSAIENYDTAIEKLQNCTRGTQEWRDALQEVNDAALQVLDSLPSDVDIGSAYSRNNDGMIELNKDTISSAQANLDKRVSTASYAAAMGNVRVQEAQVALDAKGLAEALNSYQMHMVTGGATASTQGSRTVSYQADQGVETIRKIIEENAEQLKGLTDDEFRPALEKMGVVMENISDNELSQIKASLGELGAASEQAREKMELVAKLMVDEQLGDQYDGDTKDAIAGIMAGVEDLRTSELKEWMTGSQFNKVDWMSNSKATDDLVKMFSDAMGGGYSKASNFVRGTDTNRTFAFLKDGEEVEYRAQEIAEIIAAAEALGGLEENAQKVAEIFNGLNDKIELNDENSANAKAVKGFLTDGNLNSLTDNELQGIMGLEDDELKKMLMETFGIETEEAFEAFAQELGYGSSEAIINSFKDAGGISEKALSEVGQSLTSSTRKVFDNITAGGDLTITAKQNLESTLKQIFNDFGAEGLTDFEAIIQEMGSDAGTFLENITTIDWESASPETLETKLEELGISTDKLSKDQLQVLINSLKKVGDASLDAAKEFNKNLKNAASNVDGNNSMISEEDYQALEQAGVNVRAFFQDMGDGTYQLTQDADAFKQLVHDIEMSKLEEAQQNAISKSDELANAQSWVGHVDDWEDGSILQTGAMAYALKTSGQVDNSTFEGWKDDGWVQNEEVAEKVRQAYADAGLSAEKIKEMMNDAAVEAERAQQAMDQADFAFEVDSAGLDLEETTRYAERLKKSMLQGQDATKLSKDQMRLYEKAAQDAAIANQKLDRGIGNLKSKMDDYKKALVDSNKGTAEWSEAMDSLKANIADIAGIDDFDLLSDDFAQQTLASEDLKQALEGDVDAILRLQAAAADDIMINVVANQSEDPEEIRSMWEQLKLDFEAMGDLSAPGVDQTNLINSFNDLISKGKMTKDQIEAALAGLHVSANVKTTYTTSKEQVPIQAEEQWWEPNPSADQEVPIYDDTGAQTGSYKKPAFIKKTKAWTAGYEEADVTVPSYEIEGTTGEGGSTIAFMDAPAPNPSKGGTSFSDNPSSKSSKGGGGGSSSKTFKKKDKEEKDDQKYLKRYENLTNALEELNDSLKHTASAQNDAWGNAKLAQMDRYILKVQKIAKTQKLLIQETKDYYKKDKAALLQTSVGSLAKFDDGEYGDLLNPEDLRRELQTRYEAALAAYNDAVEAYNIAASTAEGADADVEAQKEAYDAMVKSLDKDIKALDQFLETRDLLRERMEEQLENIRDWMDKKMEKIQYEIEMRIRIPERDIKQLERFISRVEDIGIETGSALAAIGTKWDKVIEEMQATWGDNGDIKTGMYRALEILENIDPNNPEHQAYFEDTFGAEAWQEYLKDTSAVPEVVIDKLHELYDQLLDYQEQLYDIAQEAFDVLARKIEMWFEKLDKIQDRLDTHLTRLEMLESILDASNIKGTQAGRDAQRQINEAKKKNAWTSAHVSDATYLGAKQVYDDLNAQYEEILAERNALGDMNADNMEEIKSYEFVLKNLKAERDKAYEDMTAAEQERNQKIGEAAQMMKEMLEQEFEMLTTEFERGLNGLFATLDGAIQMFDDMAEIRDWYLDPYERDYEFQSLLNKIDKEIEETNDPEYLKKLLDMRAKVVERQNDGKEITQEELDIENKRFELLQAEAAFEEAQNAKNKNTMRLMRDASGNYSYVYSDDEKEKDDTKQKLLDAQHNLYEAEKAAERAMDKLYYQQLQKIEQLQLKRAQALAEGDMEVVAECDRLIELATITLDRIAADEGRFSEMLRQDFGDNAAELNKSISAMIADYDNLQDAEEAHKEALIEYERQMTAATEQMQIDMERELQELGIDYKNLAQTVKTETDNINRENEEMKNEVTKMKNQGLKDLAEYTNAINSWARNFLEQMNAIIQKLKELMKAIEAAEAKANSANLNPGSNDDIINTDWEGKILEETNKGENADWDKIAEYQEYRKKKEELTGIIKEKGYLTNELNDILLPYVRENKISNSDYSGINSIFNAVAYAGDDPDKLHAALSKAGVDIKTIMGRIQGLTKGDSAIADLYNTLRLVADLRSTAKELAGKKYGATENGLYTGGLVKQNGVYELAEKGPELVLNAEDTQKILQAVQLVRGQIDAQFGAVDSRLFAKTGRVADEITPVVPKTETDAVGDQKVYIEANFPGVSVASEIEDALNSLVVQAAQYQSKYHR